MTQVFVIPNISVRSTLVNQCINSIYKYYGALHLLKLSCQFNQQIVRCAALIEGRLIASFHLRQRILYHSNPYKVFLLFFRKLHFMAVVLFAEL
jgi:hypothetical protein